VTILLGHLMEEKSVFSFVRKVLVHLVQFALQKTTRKGVLAIHLLKEMVLSFVLNVRIISLDTLFGSLLQPALKTLFFLLAIVTETPECRIDRDCPSKLACISESCQNPCTVNNPCSNSQKCVVIDSQPSKSVACVCPEGAVFGSNGQCTQGIILAWTKL
jgi:hypothetical protein